MKPILVTAVHGRREITQLFVDHYRDWDCEKVAVCTTDYDHKFMLENGWKCVKENNNPLGKKWNRALDFARGFDWTHLIQVGSDDLIRKSYLDYIDGVTFGGVKTLYFWDYPSGECIKYTYCGERKDYVLGAGRVIARDAFMKVMKETKYQLIPEHFNKGLDRGSEINMGLSGFRPEVIELPFPMIVDIKNGENIWSFKTLKERTGKVGTEYEEVDLATVKKHIGI